VLVGEGRPTKAGVDIMIFMAVRSKSGNIG